MEVNAPLSPWLRGDCDCQTWPPTGVYEDASATQCNLRFALLLRPLKEFAQLQERLG